MPKYNSKKEWETAADNLFAKGKTAQEINTLVGQYEGPEGTFTIQQAAKSKRGFTVVDKDKRKIRNDKRVEMERSQSMGVGDTVEPRGTTDQSLRAELKAGKGKEIHHRISLIQNTPFFDGLSPQQQKEFVTWANKQGWKLGNQPGNPEIVIPKADHTATHGWLRQNGIEGTKHQKALIERIQNMNMDDRKFAFRNYMEYVQGGADEFMLDSLGSRSVSPTHNAAQQRNREFLNTDAERERLRNSVGTIQSGPNKGQRLPYNRRTIGDAIIRDIRSSGRKALSAFPLAPLAAGLLSSGQAFAEGNVAEGVAEATGAIVGEVPIVGDALVSTVEGTPVADGTVTGWNRDRLLNPLHYGKKGPNVPRPGQREKIERLKANPSSERGYETIQRVVTDGWNGLKQLFMSQ
jgi:hypothetical protein